MVGAARTGDDHSSRIGMKEFALRLDQKGHKLKRTNGLGYGLGSL